MAIFNTYQQLNYRESFPEYVFKTLLMIRNLAILLTCFLVSVINNHGQKELRKLPLTAATDTVPRNAEKLITAYPDFVKRYENNHIILKDGTKLLWDDGIKNKPAKLLLYKPDIEDMFNQKYSIDIQKIPPATNV